MVCSKTMYVEKETKARKKKKKERKKERSAHKYMLAWIIMR